MTLTKFKSFGKKYDSSRVFTTSFLNDVSLKILTRVESSHAITATTILEKLFRRPST